MANFKASLILTLNPDHEGGFQNQPNDHANWTSGKIGEGELVGTNHGITALDIPKLQALSIFTPIKDLNFDEAGTFYQKYYWNPLYDQITDQFLADKLFDMGVLFGVGEAVKLLQIVLAQYHNVAVDDKFGPGTLAALEASEPNSLLQAYKTALVSYTLRIAAVNPAERGDVAGWGRRINS